MRPEKEMPEHATIREKYDVICAVIFKQTGLPKSFVISSKTDSYRQQGKRGSHKFVVSKDGGSF